MSLDQAVGADTKGGDEPAALLRTSGGDIVPLNPQLWTDRATPAEMELLERSLPPVVDLGCGPGRHVIALAELGIPALGIDTSPAALAFARQRGASVLEKSIFDELPGTGTWGTALLLDGNIGIGGDPVMLLSRVAALLGSEGRALIEVGSPAAISERLTVRVEIRGRQSKWFPWYTLAADDLEPVAGSAGWLISDLWSAEDRWFAQLDRR